MRGSADFLGLNYYTSRLVEVLKQPSGPNPSHERDSMLKSAVKPEWKRAKSAWLYAVPSGLGDILRFHLLSPSSIFISRYGKKHFLQFFRWIKKAYNNTDVMITENGWSDDGQMDDLDRIEYMRSHLAEILDIVLNDECNLKGYTGVLNRNSIQYCYHFISFSLSIQFGQSSITSNGTWDTRKWIWIRERNKLNFRTNTGIFTRCLQREVWSVCSEFEQFAEGTNTKGVGPVHERCYQNTTHWNELNAFYAESREFI